MPTNYKYASVQGTASTGTYATLYNAPTSPSTQSVISTICICNTAGTSATYNIGFATSATTPSAADIMVSGSFVPANDTVFLTLGISLDPGRFIRVSSSASTVSFQAFVSEIT